VAFPVANPSRHEALGKPCWLMSLLLLLSSSLMMLHWMICLVWGCSVGGPQAPEATAGRGHVVHGCCGFFLHCNFVLHTMGLPDDRRPSAVFDADPGCLWRFGHCCRMMCPLFLMRKLLPLSKNSWDGLWKLCSAASASSLWQQPPWARYGCWDSCSGLLLPAGRVA